MGQGLQVWNAAGVLIFDSADRLARVFGRTTVAAGTTGYITDSRFAQGTIWWQVLSTSTAGGVYTPNLSADPANNRIAYTPQSSFAGAVDVVVTYGVY